MDYVTRDGLHRHPVDAPIWRCPETGAPVNLTPGAGLSRDQIDPSERSLWRYAKAIRVDKTARVELGEGWTPLIPVELPAGDVRLKMESMAPSGSFKDRGMAVLVAYLRAHGIDRVMLDSSGNAAASLACYAAAAGLHSTRTDAAHACMRPTAAGLRRTQLGESSGIGRSWPGGGDETGGSAAAAAGQSARSASAAARA